MFLYSSHGPDTSAGQLDLPSHNVQQRFPTPGVTHTHNFHIMAQTNEQNAKICKLASSVNHNQTTAANGEQYSNQCCNVTGIDVVIGGVLGLY